MKVTLINAVTWLGLSLNDALCERTMRVPAPSAGFFPGANDKVAGYDCEIVSCIRERGTTFPEASHDDWKFDSRAASPPLMATVCGRGVALAHC